MSVCEQHVCLVQTEMRRGSIGSSRTEVIDSYELPYGCWESNPCPLEGQLVLFASDLSL